MLIEKSRDEINKEFPKIIDSWFKELSKTGRFILCRERDKDKLKENLMKLFEIVEKEDEQRKD